MYLISHIVISVIPFGAGNMISPFGVCWHLLMVSHYFWPISCSKTFLAQRKHSLCQYKPIYNLNHFHLKGLTFNVNNIYFTRVVLYFFQEICCPQSRLDSHEMKAALNLISSRIRNHQILILALSGQQWSKAENKLFSIFMQYKRCKLV